MSGAAETIKQSECGRRPSSPKLGEACRLQPPRHAMWRVSDVVGVAYGRLIQNHRHFVFLHHGIHNLLRNAIESVKVLGTLEEIGR